MKITARDIHLFVAGALSLNGFYSLCWMFVHAAYVRDRMLIVPHVIGCFILTLGISMFTGNTRTVRLVEILLWIGVVGGFIGMILFCFLFPSSAVQSIAIQSPTMLASAILLGLMIWSRSRKFRHEPDV